MMLTTPGTRIPVDRKTLRVLVAAALLYADAELDPVQEAHLLASLRPYLGVLADDTTEIMN